jgi:hypothetical protein
MLLASDALALKALRFGFVGALSGLVFAVTTAIFDRQDWHESEAGVGGRLSDVYAPDVGS